MANRDAAINEQFMRALGRQANPYEINYFTKFIDDGHLDPYEIGQILYGTPEAEQSRVKTQGQEYQNYLAGADQDILDRSGQQIRSDFARQGRTLGGSSYVSAMANAARDLAIQRQPQVAAFYGQGFGRLNDAYGSQASGAMGRGYGLRDERRHRDYEIADYYRMQNDFNTYLNAQNRQRKQTALAQGIGSGLGAGLGASLGGPAGARVGSGIGGSLGGAF